jgi:antibiotic biosynthesis monooxygenase (ABM) superfamily enzyme
VIKVSNIIAKINSLTVFFIMLLSPFCICDILEYFLTRSKII